MGLLISLQTSFIDYQAQQVVLVLSELQESFLSPAQSVLLFQRCHLLLACLQYGNQLAQHLRSSFREEFRFVLLLFSAQYQNGDDSSLILVEYSEDHCFFPPGTLWSCHVLRRSCRLTTRSANRLYGWSSRSWVCTDDRTQTHVHLYLKKRLCDSLCLFLSLRDLCFELYTVEFHCCHEVTEQ